jgi:hypothetical protein
MAYGMEVLNSSGRTIFNTEQTNSNYYFQGPPTSTNGYGVNPSFSYNSTRILFGRPQDNETGAIFFSGSVNDTNYYLGGRTTYEQNFGAANGVKYIYGYQQKGNVTASGSGYGIEVYDTNGTSILYSSNIGSNFEILYVGTMANNTNFTWNKPAGYDFNDIYVTAGSFSLKYTYNPGYPGFGIPPTHSLYGNWAYFDDANERILIKQGSLTSVIQLSASNTASSYNTAQTQDYLIVARLA